MLFNRQEKNPDDFWREYEEKTGEKVLARSLGQYISGWDEFDSRKWTKIWGLVIATSGGFRFHHFPQIGWLDTLGRFTNQEMPKEKTFFITKEKIISAEFCMETRWWKKLLSNHAPVLVIHYRDESGNERRLLLEAENKAGDVAEKLSALRRN